MSVSTPSSVSTVSSKKSRPALQRLAAFPTGERREVVTKALVWSGVKPRRVYLGNGLWHGSMTGIERYD